MAIDVLNNIKAAEEKAQEIRRVAAIAAKDAVKLASQENAAYEDEELTQARRTSIKKVDDGREAAKAELEKLQAQRLLECEALKENARKKLALASDVCLERILK